MNKEIVTVEFRYHKKEYGFTTKTLTIGVYDTLEEAIIEGNKALDKLSKFLELKADDKFSTNGFLGRPNKLVVKRSEGVECYAKIETLKFDDLTETIKKCLKSAKEYRNYKRSQEY